ncbi:MAG: hypothetical protein BRD38_02990 [Bacteroidetes bacterium QH_9_67_14]|nr:MAG: hypothetical protein BRD38_02990 [Bacteroidetes bacterium QH_9_67_14]
MKKRFFYVVTLVLLLAAAGRAQAQEDSLRVLIADNKHPETLKPVFDRTASGYGLAASVDVRPIVSNTVLVDTAIAEGYDLVLPARRPSGRGIVAAAARAWENGIAFVSPHGPNDHVRHEATSGVSKRGPLFIGGENLTPGSERSYGKNLELDVLTLNGKSAQSYAPIAGAAILGWVYKTATDSTVHDSTRWRKARTMMRKLAGVYDPIETPSDLDASDNFFDSEAAASFAYGKGHKDSVTTTSLGDGRVRIQAERGGHELKYHKFFNGPFPAGVAFSEITVTNQGDKQIEVSKGLYGRKPVPPDTTKTFVFRSHFQARQRSRTRRYRVWASSAGDSVDVVIEPLIYTPRQPELPPDYDAQRTDKRGAGLVVATLAGRADQNLSPTERQYARQQRERLDSVEAANLPVELRAFTGRVEGRTAVLEWETLTETNSRGFYVEQQTDDGAWEQVGGLVEGAGTSRQPHRYSKRVEGLDFGRHVFRLRQVDRDGGNEVFDERRVKLNVRMTDAYALEEVYPNPTQGRATVSFAVQQPQAVTVALYNTLGQRVKVLREGKTPGGETVTVSFNADRLSSGLYFVRLRGEDFTATEAVTIVR